ncbi:MAG TPA: NAD-dependent epimerase/dehydratase family protein [Candidatus Woesearchaeota archaeon]|nr:NAD-dependent epimerase/dehydratase family protein [Candidatus Woesearchaeota archaeon]
MKILVTGCAGFIGSHVAEALLLRGDTVIGIDNINDYYDPAKKEKNLEILKKHKKFVFYKEDIRNYDNLKRIFIRENPDKVVHLAARAGVRASIQNPLLYQEVNIRGTLNLLELAKNSKAKSFVFASSSSVYGNQEKTPFSEDDDVSTPISPYAATKRAGELLCYTYHHIYNTSITCLRFFTVYGPRGRPDMAPYKFTKLIIEGKPVPRYGDGTTKRDYTYITDIVKGVIAAIDKELSFEIINLGNNKPVMLNDFIRVIEEATHRKAIIKEMPMQPGDVNITYADIRKAQRLLGYQPETSIEEGMKKFVEWYEKDV